MLHVLHHPKIAFVPYVELEVKFVVLGQVAILFKGVNFEEFIIPPALSLFKIRSKLPDNGYFVIFLVQHFDLVVILLLLVPLHHFQENRNVLIFGWTVSVRVDLEPELDSIQTDGVRVDYLVRVPKNRVWVHHIMGTNKGRRDWTYYGWLNNWDCYFWSGRHHLFYILANGIGLLYDFALRLGCNWGLYLIFELFELIEMDYYFVFTVFQLFEVCFYFLIDSLFLLAHVFPQVLQVLLPTAFDLIRHEIKQVVVLLNFGNHGV